MLRGPAKPDDTVYIALPFLDSESQARYCLRDPDGTWYFMTYAYFMEEPLVAIRHEHFAEAHPYISALDMEPSTEAGRHASNVPWNKNPIEFGQWEPIISNTFTEIIPDEGPTELKIHFARNESEKSAHLRLMWNDEPVKITILCKDYYRTNAGGHHRWKYGDGSFLPHANQAMEGFRKWKRVEVAPNHEIFSSRFQYDESAMGYEMQIDTMVGQATLDPSRKTCVIFIDRNFDNSQ